MSNLFAMFFGLFGIAFLIGFFAIIVYLYVLLIKLSRRGIKVMDVWIEHQSNRDIR